MSILERNLSSSSFNSFYTQKIAQKKVNKKSLGLIHVNLKRAYLHLENERSIGLGVTG